MTGDERTELNRLRRIERLAFAWKRASVAYQQAVASTKPVPLEEQVRLMHVADAAEVALYAELIEQEDDGHGQKD